MEVDMTVSDDPTQ
jgi:hypothetical protein